MVWSYNKYTKLTKTKDKNSLRDTIEKIVQNNAFPLHRLNNGII